MTPLFSLHPTVLVTLFGGTALCALLALWLTMSRKGRSEDEARAYLAGVNYVISDDPDAAIAELSKAAQLNTQTLETYFALGALFRRKGEMERAIRLHRNMLLRPGLASEVRSRAQLELGLDYRGAGMSDQAHEVYDRLLSENPENREGLLRLRQLLEDRRDWQAAVELQKRWIALEGKGEEILAHLLAELARVWASSANTEATMLAERAVSLVPACANAQLALAEAYLAGPEPERAFEPLRRAMQLEAEVAPRVLPLFVRLGPSDRIAAQLDAQISSQPETAYPFELARAQIYERQGEIDHAIAALRRIIDRRPDAWEARKELGRVLLSTNRADELRADYEEILRTLGQPTTAFICRECRQKLPEHLFRCPSCGAWDAIVREPLNA